MYLSNFQKLLGLEVMIDHGSYYLPGSLGSLKSIEHKVKSNQKTKSKTITGLAVGVNNL